jgi:ribosomal protein S18 acetylase RimI-like enzyme
MEWTRDDYLVSTDKDRLDVTSIHRFLSEEAYWSRGIPRSVVERAIHGSRCLGLYRSGRTVGFARIVTDGATFAYLCDVYVLASERGHGLGKWLVELACAHPELAGLRRWLLVTRDAQGLYEPYGFRPIAHPARFMERVDANVYDKLPTP